MGGTKEPRRGEFCYSGDEGENWQEAKNKDECSAGLEGNSKDYEALGRSEVNFKKFP